MSSQENGHFNRLQNDIRADKDLLRKILNTEPSTESRNDEQFRPTRAGKLYEVFSTWMGEPVDED